MYKVLHLLKKDIKWVIHIKGVGKMVMKMKEIVH
jgi:hypothetical protein